MSSASRFVVGCFVVALLALSLTSPVRSQAPEQPLVIRDEEGMHLGNRPNSDWNGDLLEYIDGNRIPNGLWPKTVVLLSNQLYNVTRDSNCRITGVYTDAGRATILNYLYRATPAGVRIIIRIYPSPGNFDPNDPGHVLQAGPISGIGYCLSETNRPAQDIADEINAIHNYNQLNGVAEYGFEPANEPNTEWYDDQVEGDSRDNASSWTAMDTYFTQVWRGVPSTTRVLTPPMNQGWYAEGRLVRWEGLGTSPPCNNQLLDNFSNGYTMMQTYYASKNDGVDWHNYWRFGYEGSGGCDSGGMHTSYYFPGWMQSHINTNIDKTNITEVSLYSDRIDPAEIVNPKDEVEGWLAANSLDKFVRKEGYSNSIVGWMLNDAIPTNCHPNLEYTWHEAYPCEGVGGPRDWFRQWWSCQKNADVSLSGDVDVFDIQLVADAWDDSFPPSYADVNCASGVDIGDVQLVASLWGF